MNEHPVQRVPVIAAVEALTQAMRVWDEDCFRHSVNTAAYAAAIARELGMDAEAADEVRIGALLHDIGKMGVDLGVLRKPAGSTTTKPSTSTCTRRSARRSSSGCCHSRWSTVRWHTTSSRTDGVTPAA